MGKTRVRFEKALETPPWNRKKALETPPLEAKRTHKRGRTGSCPSLIPIMCRYVPAQLNNNFKLEMKMEGPR